MELKNEKAVERTKKMTPVIRDIMLSVLGTKKPEVFMDVNGRVAMKKELFDGITGFSRTTALRPSTSPISSCSRSAPMEQLLSQEEIDALLKGISEGDVETAAEEVEAEVVQTPSPRVKAQILDFAKYTKGRKEKLPSLEFIQTGCQNP